MEPDLKSSKSYALGKFGIDIGVLFFRFGGVGVFFSILWNQRHLLRCFVVGVGSQSCFFKCFEFGFEIRVVIVLIDFALI